MFSQKVRLVHMHLSFHRAASVRDAYNVQSSLRLQWPAKLSLTAEFPIDFHVVSLLSGSVVTKKRLNILSKSLFCREPVKLTGQNNNNNRHHCGPFGFQRTTNATLAHDYSSSIFRLIFDRCFFPFSWPFRTTLVGSFFFHPFRSNCCVLSRGMSSPEISKTIFSPPYYVLRGSGPRWKCPPSSQ